MGKIFPWRENSMVCTRFLSLWILRCGKKISDSNSSSEKSASASDSSNCEGAIGGDIVDELIEPFSGIQLWRFEPPARSRTQDRKEEAREPPRRRCDLDSEEWFLMSNAGNHLNYHNYTNINHLWEDNFNSTRQTYNKIL